MLTNRAAADQDVDDEVQHFLDEATAAFVAIGLSPDIATLKPWQPTLTGPAEPERFNGQRVSASYFHVLGVRPAFGRDFDPADDRLNGPNVVILGDALWRRRFGGDTAIVGRQVTLNDSLFTVIGVMPSTFENALAPAASSRRSWPCWARSC